WPRRMGRLPRGGVDRNIKHQSSHLQRCRVASRAEAWIETPGRRAATAGAGVASRAEAWIETDKGAVEHYMARSPPARRRGSKLRDGLGGIRLCQVASRAEAWIETSGRGRACGH